jgi:hypothetical protein
VSTASSPNLRSLIDQYVVDGCRHMGGPCLPVRTGSGPFSFEWLPYLIARHLGIGRTSVRRILMRAGSGIAHSSPT